MVLGIKAINARIAQQGTLKRAALVHAILTDATKSVVAQIMANVWCKIQGGSACAMKITLALSVRTATPVTLRTVAEFVKRTGVSWEMLNAQTTGVARNSMTHTIVIVLMGIRVLLIIAKTAPIRIKHTMISVILKIAEMVTYLLIAMTTEPAISLEIRLGAHVKNNTEAIAVRTVKQTTKKKVTSVICMSAGHRSAVIVVCVRLRIPRLSVSAMIRIPEVIVKIVFRDT